MLYQLPNGSAVNPFCIESITVECDFDPYSSKRQGERKWFVRIYLKNSTVIVKAASEEEARSLCREIVTGINAQ